MQQMDPMSATTPSDAKGVSIHSESAVQVVPRLWNRLDGNWGMSGPSNTRMSIAQGESGVQDSRTPG